MHTNRRRFFLLSFVVSFFLCQQSLQAAISSVVELNGAREGCQATFIAPKVAVTLASCLNNFHTGNVSVDVDGERIWSRDVVVHPYIYEKEISDPTRVSGILDIALVEFPEGVVEGTTPIAKDYKNSIARFVDASVVKKLAQLSRATLTDKEEKNETASPGSPVYNQAGEMVALSQGCSENEDVCQLTSLHDEVSIGVFNKAKEQLKEETLNVSLPAEGHILGGGFLCRWRERRQARRYCPPPPPSCPPTYIRKNTYYRVAPIPPPPPVRKYSMPVYTPRNYNIQQQQSNPRQYNQQRQNTQQRNQQNNNQRQNNPQKQNNRQNFAPKNENNNNFNYSPKIYINVPAPKKSKSGSSSGGSGGTSYTPSYSSGGGSYSSGGSSSSSYQNSYASRQAQREKQMAQQAAQRARRDAQNARESADRERRAAQRARDQADVQRNLAAAAQRRAEAAEARQRAEAKALTEFRIQAEKQISQKFSQLDAQQKAIEEAYERRSNFEKQERQERRQEQQYKQQESESKKQEEEYTQARLIQEQRLAEEKVRLAKLLKEQEHQRMLIARHAWERQRREMAGIAEAQIMQARLLEDGKRAEQIAQNDELRSRLNQAPLSEGQKRAFLVERGLPNILAAAPKPAYQGAYARNTQSLPSTTGTETLVAKSPKALDSTSVAQNAVAVNTDTPFLKQDALVKSRDSSAAALVAMGESYRKDGARTVVVAARVPELRVDPISVGED